MWDENANFDSAGSQKSLMGEFGRSRGGREGARGRPEVGGCGC